MDYFKLIRTWFDFAFENPEKIKPNHIALYTFCVEHCNRLGWKKKFGLPTEMAKDAIGIKSYHTYIKTLRDLVDFGFIKMIEISKNQYSSNIIALSYFDKALDKALDKAMIKHGSKQGESTDQSISSIIKHITNIPINKYTSKQIDLILNHFIIKENIIPTFEEFKIYALENKNVSLKELELKYKAWKENEWNDGNGKKIKNWKSKLLQTLPYINEVKIKANKHSDFNSY